MSDIKKNTCDWCLQEAPVQAIGEKLWRFWKVISAESPIVASHRNICEQCKSCYEDFLIYIDRCKAHASIVDEILSGGNVKYEPSIDIEYNPLIKGEILNEDESHPYRPTASGGVLGDSNFPDRSEELPSSRKVQGGQEVSINNRFTNKASDSDYRMMHRDEGNTDSVARIASKLEACSYCHQVFDHPSKLRAHMRIHSVRNLSQPFECSHCGKAFTRVNGLNVHLRIHTGERPFQCPLCDKTFTQSNALKIHLRSHTGERPFQCHHCDKAFAHSGDLTKHLRVHSGVRPFRCSHCDKTFVESVYLRVHSRVHTGERPFGCSHCVKSFARSGDLTRHLRVHTGERPFKCASCGKAFADSSKLKRHSFVHDDSG